MQRIVIALALLNVIRAATVHLDPSHLESSKEQQSVNEYAPSVNPIYLPTTNNNPPPARYPYPTYPDHSSNGYAVQPGYESYIAPKTAVAQKSNQWSSGSIVSSLIPIVNSLVLYGTRTSVILLQLLLVALMGVGITSLICTYTSVCNISFLGINRNEVKEQVTELARTYITPESLRMASLLVSQAIDKYSALENEQEKNVTKESSDNQPTTI